jgi:DNA-binding CsgD family transcriptional regulator
MQNLTTLADSTNDIISTNFKKKLNEIIVVEGDLPGVVIIHDIRDWSVAYMSPKGLSSLGIDLETIQNMNIEEYHKRYFNPDDAKDYAPKILELLQRDNDDESISYFQQVRYSESQGWIWHISSTKIFMRSEDGKPLYTITISTPVDPLHPVSAKVSRLLEENNFLKKNYCRFAKLGKRECEVLKLLAMGKTAAEIAEALFISVLTVDTHRKNIKQKLETSSLYELSQYARAFNLI